MTPTPQRVPAPAPGPDAERRLGARLALGALAAVLISVPFTLLALLVLARFEPLEAADRQVAEALHAQVLPRPALGRILEVLAVVTHPNAMRAVALAIAVVLWTRGRRRLVAWLAVTMAVGGLLSPLLKALVARARPALNDPVTTASGYSFPSGHALNSMLLAACLVVLINPRARRAAVWALAAVLVIVTGLDRIALGVHYVSDVLAGWTVALATVTATTVAFATWRRSEGLPLPSADAGLDPGPGVTQRRERAWARVLARLAAGLVLRWAVVLAVLVGTGLLLTRVAGAVWPLTAEDGVSRALAAARTPAGSTVTALMSGLGNTSAIVPLCLLAVVLLRIVLHRWRESLFVGAVTLGQSIVFVLTTAAIDRERPAVPHLDESPPTSSFPSGHTSAAIALYTGLAVVAHRRIRSPWLRRGVMALLLCLPALVALGRLYRGMHHPSDLVGSLLGAGLILLLTDRLLSATPLPDDGGVPRAGVAGPLAVRPRPRRAGPPLQKGHRMNASPTTEPVAQTVALVMNPVKAGDPAGLAEQLQQRCREAGLPDPLVFETTEDDPGHGQTERALAAGADVVLAAGGDGTIRVVAEALTGRGVPLAVLPQGTGNLLARNLGLPLDLDGALDAAVGGQDRAIDVGRLVEPGAACDGSVFTVMAGTGFDAAMMREAPEGLKSAVGWPAYIVGGARGLRRSHARVDVSLDGGPPFRARVRSLLIANVGRLQGGLCLAPDARADDGRLDVVLVAPRRVTDWLVLLARGVSRRRRQDHRLRSYPARDIRVRMHQPQPRQIDGDLIADGAQLAARIEPGALLVRFPADRAQRWARAGGGGPRARGPGRAAVSTAARVPQTSLWEPGELDADDARTTLLRPRCSAAPCSRSRRAPDLTQSTRLCSAGCRLAGAAGGWRWSSVCSRRWWR